MAGVGKTKDGKKCMTNSIVWARKAAKRAAWEQVPKEVEKVTQEDCGESAEGLGKHWFELTSTQGAGHLQELQQHGYFEDQATHLEQGEKGVAFDRRKEQENEEEKEEEDYRI